MTISQINIRSEIYIQNRNMRFTTTRPELHSLKLIRKVIHCFAKSGAIFNRGYDIIKVRAGYLWLFKGA